MAKIFSLLLVLAMGAACGAPEAPAASPLLGTWRSDKAATLAEIDLIGGFPPRVRGSLEATLGRRTLTYTETRLTARLEDEARSTSSGPYRVVASRGKELVVEAYDDVLGQTEQRSLVVDGDRMWLWMDGGRWREFYRRVP